VERHLDVQIHHLDVNLQTVIVLNKNMINYFNRLAKQHLKTLSSTKIIAIYMKNLKSKIKIRIIHVILNNNNLISQNQDFNVRKLIFKNKILKTVNNVLNEDTQKNSVMIIY